VINQVPTHEDVSALDESEWSASPPEYELPVPVQ